jgi:indole-3-glycerol phosphate synthase/phosphoribosylanthranilate isomerase
MSDGLGVLGRIVAETRERLVQRRREFPLDRIMALSPTPGSRRSFGAALVRTDRANVIAEFKRRSPSRGVIREDLHPVRVAQAYEVAGAAALSVLTEERHFGGSLDDLQEARAATLLPTLRKDFVVDPYQIWEAWYAGADAVLLIAAVLSDRELAVLAGTAEEAGLDAVFEVHDAEELARALAAGARILGVNNRDLRTMQVSLETGLALASRIPDEVVAVAESGIRSGVDIRRLRDAGYDAFLIGERLMESVDPGEALEGLLAEAAVPAAAMSHGPSHIHVKVCGITSVEDALAAARAGADAIGFIFWSRSPRFVSVETARRICRALPPFVTRVGVFVDALRQDLVSTAEAVGLDVLQLHGSESPQDIAGLPRRVLKALRVGSDFRVEDALRYQGCTSGILLDTRVEGLAGGTGQTFDWSVAREVRRRTPFLALAGGLDPDNVRDAIEAARPDAVDVSSGVESSPGRKDPERVRAFIDAVRRAEA